MVWYNIQNLARKAHGDAGRKIPNKALINATFVCTINK
jgi:hypothetical protein